MLMRVEVRQFRLHGVGRVDQVAEFDEEVGLVLGELLGGFGELAGVSR